jgi:hypothetical protein
MVSITVRLFFLRPFFQILMRLASPTENGARSKLPLNGAISTTGFPAIVFFTNSRKV